VRIAIDVGYRHIDTAAIYKNEADVGKAVKDSRVPREEIFITTKVWNDDMRAGTTLQAFDHSRKLLQTDTIDLYLVHWPVAGKYVETWKTLEKLYANGVVRAIGVSNHMIHHLEDVLAVADIVPAINQIEWHPELRSPALHQYCIDKGIQLEAWAPLMQGKAFDMPIFKEIAAKYNKTVAQLLIRWDLQHQVVTLPKTITPSRIESNTHVFDFEISPEDMARIDALDKGARIAADPDNFDF
jgi:diketogulonate reductase-like aldo/keto reductase